MRFRDRFLCGVGLHAYSKSGASRYATLYVCDFCHRCKSVRKKRKVSANQKLLHRLKHWLYSLRHHDTIIQFDEAPAKGVNITFSYTGSVEQEVEQ